MSTKLIILELLENSRITTEEALQLQLHFGRTNSLNLCQLKSMRF